MRRAVLYHSPSGRVNGALLDALDYWIVSQERDQTVELQVAGIRPAQLRTVVESRYDSAGDLNWAKISTGRSRLHFLGQGFDAVLCGYSTLQRIYGLVRAGRFHVLPTWLMRRDSTRGQIKAATAAHVCFYLDPAQHRYEVSQRRDYTKKLYLRGLRRPEASDSAVLVNCMSGHKAVDPSEILRICAKLGVDSAEVRVLGRRRCYEPAGLRVWEPPVEDLFTKYDRYLYIPAVGGYDENPRLLLESAWLGKEVLVGGDLPPDDGAFHKLSTLRENPSRFHLETDDSLVREFLNDGP